MRLKGDGRRYKLIVRISQEWDAVGYTASFDTVGGQWQSVSKLWPVITGPWLRIFLSIIGLFFFQIRLPFSSLRPIFRARTVADAPSFDPSNVVSFQACLLSLLPYSLSFLICCNVPDIGC